MSLEFLVNGKPMAEIILEYLSNKEFVSVGEINQYCSGQNTGVVEDISRPINEIHDNYLFFLSVVKTVRNLKEEGLVEVKDIENHLWVKLKQKESEE